MSSKLFVVVLGSLFLCACGTTEKTTVVAPPGSTVVVPSDHDNGTTVVHPGS